MDAYLWISFTNDKWNYMNKRHMIYVRFNGHDSNFQFTTNAMVNDGTKVKASSRLVKDEELKVHSSKRAKCGCQTETFMVIMQCPCCQASCDN